MLGTYALQPSFMFLVSAIKIYRCLETEFSYRVRCGLSQRAASERLITIEYYIAQLIAKTKIYL